MRKKLTPIDIDPAEKWLARLILGNSANFMRPEEATFETKKNINNLIYCKLDETNQRDPPFNPELLFNSFKKIKFQKIEEMLPDGIYGELIPVKGGFIIRIDPYSHPFRKRLTIAHEIGHSFFYDWESEIPTLRFNNSRYWVQEGYALEIARAILLPKASIEKTVFARNFSPSIHSLQELRNIYEVSFDILRRRLINDLKIWDSLVFISKIEGGKILTNSVNISKGLSYKSLTIPRIIIEHERNYDSLYSTILSAYERGLTEDTIKIGKDFFLVQSLRLKGQMILSLITKSDAYVIG